MLIYDMLLELRDKLTTEDEGLLVSFKAFQRKGQNGRIDHLSQYRCINSGLLGHFSELCKIRRNYLHFYLQDLHRLKDDALHCYESAFEVARSVLTHTLSGTEIAFTPALHEYLAIKGIVRD